MTTDDRHGRRRSGARPVGATLAALALAVSGAAAGRSGTGHGFEPDAPSGPAARPASDEPRDPATGRALSDAQWLADLEQVVAAVAEIHPDPFGGIDEEAFAAAAARLRDQIPTLGDQGIVVRLAELVALLGDGHTRIFLPRQHPELAPALEVGHSGTDPPADPALELAQLPLRFGLFSDGLVVTHAAPPHGDLVGRRVVTFGTRDVAAALEAAQATIAAENASRRRALVTDRLALPAVLAAAGLSDSADRVTLVLDGDGGEATVVLEPLGRGEVTWSGGPSVASPASRRPDARAWFEVLGDDDAIYVRVDELEALPEQPWARFVAATLAAAEAAGVGRYVLDLRANAGGDASWVTPFVNGLAGGRYDRFGRLMVLIGGSTFSAAQTLVNQLERYTEACFVGEPSGAAPTHFGDSKKVVLEASGLTLRVSTRYWPNWLAGEFREATEAHVDAVASSEDYFAGRDPALAAALGYDPPARVPAQVEDLLRRGKTQAGILRFMRHVSDPRVEDLEGPAFVAAGHRLLDEGLVREGRILFVLAAEYLPASAEAEAGWGRALELEGDPEAAARHYGRALALDPRNAAAAEALARLAPAEGGASPPGP